MPVRRGLPEGPPEAMIFVNVQVAGNGVDADQSGFTIQKTAPKLGATALFMI